MEEVSCPDNINSVYCLLSGHETLSTEFSNATEIHCTSRPTRLRLTRAQKREASRRRVQPAIPNELPRKQQEDEEIQHWRAGEDPSRVTVKDGVLFRVWRPRNSEQTYEQIVLPASYRDRVLKLAHSVPTTGHLGREKTAQRILRRFFWPTLFKHRYYKITWMGNRPEVQCKSPY